MAECNVEVELGVIVDVEVGEWRRHYLVFPENLQINCLGTGYSQRIRLSVPKARIEERCFGLTFIPIDHPTANSIRHERNLQEEAQLCQQYYATQRHLVKQVAA